MRKFLSMAYLLYLSATTKGTGISEEKRSIGASSSLSPVQVMLEIRPIADRAMGCNVYSESFTWLLLSSLLPLQSHIVNPFCLCRSGRPLSDLVRLGARRARRGQAELSEPSVGLWKEGEFSAAELARANARGSEGDGWTDAASAPRSRSPPAKAGELKAAS